MSYRFSHPAAYSFNTYRSRDVDSGPTWKSNGQRRKTYSTPDADPSAVKDDLKKAIMFGLSLKTFTTLPALHEQVTARGVKISADDLLEALEKMAAYKAVVAEGDGWKRNR